MTRPTAADLAFARQVLQTEADAILALVDRLDERFDRAIQLLLGCRGRVIVTGMGKSGIICRKIAATLSSTGTPAFFLHPAEAIHGDLGVIQADDVVIALSNSGETEELVRLLETIKRLGARLITISGDSASTLAQASDVALDCHVSEEACPMNLVPTASTTAALALGDALAMTLLVAKGFREEDFAHLHPGGTLGRRLRSIEAVMHGGGELPLVTATTLLRDAIYTMSSKGFGILGVLDQEGGLAGVLSDGDLRRLMADPDRSPEKVFAHTVAEVMHRAPKVVPRNARVQDALVQMEEHRITALFVVERDDLRKVVGIVHLHDLWGGRTPRR